jgi:hypothetical protein
MEHESLNAARRSAIVIFVMRITSGWFVLPYEETLAPTRHPTLGEGRQADPLGAQ